ncbi:MAG TPA: hypothetical protein DCS05_03870 [Nitrospiraceae bacterium]|nr:hypothetical protein [Nitrospiraceae bacterium]
MEEQTILSRDDFFAVDDSLVVKEVTVPDTIPVWAGKKFFIRCLSRGEQDEYSKRQMGDSRIRMGRKSEGGEMAISSMFGHDAYLVVCGVCDPNGKRLFQLKDTSKIDEKLGELVGWLAKEIAIFSGMGEDERVAKGEIYEEEALQEEIKN